MSEKSFIDIIDGYKNKEYFTDAVFCVFDDKGLLYSCATGGVSRDAVFDLASCTKLFTSTLILEKINDGSMDLDANISEYISVPESLTKLNAAMHGVTVRELMTHTSGFISWYPFYASDRDFFETLEDLTAPVHEKNGMEYSDINYILLGKIVENIYGMNLADAVVKYLKRPLATEVLDFAPLRDSVREKTVISSYGNEIEEAMCAERGLSFPGFRVKGEPIKGEANDGNCFYAFKGVSGHAGLFGAADALMKLGMYYMNTKKEILITAQENHGYERGLGFQLGEMYPEGCGHTGFTGTSLYISRKNKTGAVLLTNRLTMTKKVTPPDLTALRTLLHKKVLTERKEGRL